MRSRRANAEFCLRAYTPSDCAALAELFDRTVHTVNARDYTAEQLDAWSPGTVDLDEWNRSLLTHHTLVAVRGERIVGFGDMDASGYLDRLFVDRDCQRQGIASALCDALERTADTIVTHASITARPFFERRGYRVIREQQVIRRGVFLTNYVMVKCRLNGAENENQRDSK